MKVQAFSASSISESIVAFAQFARSHHMNVGIQETQDALAAIKELGITDRNTFKFALKPLFCTSPEDCGLFEKLFILYWDTNPLDLDPKNKTTMQGAVEKEQAGSLVMMGEGENSDDDQEGKNVTGASEAERLRKTDFSKINDVDAKHLEQIADKLFKEMTLRLRRRMKDSNRNGQINLRRTIRRSIAYGGEAIDLVFRAQRPKKQRLVIFLDVSGSMDKYSFFLLRFIFALRENFRQLEAFIFSTKLIRISGVLAGNQMEYAATLLTQQVDNWSSGTRIGDSLEEFNDKYGKRMLNGSPTIIILSDGLDTGEPEILGRELRKIQGRSRKVVWLNPLKGMKDYQPIQRGMKAALPSVDDFMAAHNLNSLLELENILIHV
jgi:uncharacterized protein with von Willebrand factor type A (vWA) domain